MFKHLAFKSLDVSMYQLLKRLHIATRSQRCIHHLGQDVSLRIDKRLRLRRGNARSLKLLDVLKGVECDAAHGSKFTRIDCIAIKKPRQVARAGFLSFNRQLACASVGLEQVDNASAEESSFGLGYRTSCNISVVVSGVHGRAFGQVVGASQCEAVAVQLSRTVGAF